MSKPFGRLRRFLRELKRRKVYRVAAGYLVAAFVVLQLAGLAADAFGFPAWFQPMIWVVAGLGFPLAVVLAWAFEVTPQGVRRTPEAEPIDEDTTETEQGLSAGYKVLVGLGLVGAAVAGGWYLTGGGGSTVTDRSVAVLPFQTLGDTSAGSLTAGVHNALINRLQKVSDLTVIARPSVLRYGDYQETDKTLSQVADELNVRWIVAGAVQTAGDQIMVNPRLVDPRSGTERWSETYRRDLSARRLFDLQSDITKKIAASLEAELTPEEEKRVERRRVGSLDTYRLYVQGRSSLYQRTEAGARRALSYFRRAIERDSTYARAWAGLSDVLALQGAYGYDLPVGGGMTAERAARRAFMLDSMLGETQAAYGYSVADGFDRLRGFRRAIELNPNYAQAYHWLGIDEVRLGRLDSAVAHLERGVELDPMAAALRGSLAFSYVVSNRDSAAVTEMRKAVEAAPSLGTVYSAQGVVLSAAGRHRDALSAFDRAVEMMEEDAGWREAFEGWRGIAHARIGNRDSAEKVAATLAGKNDATFKRTLIYLGLDDNERAVAALEGAEPGEWAWPHVGLFRYGSSFDPIRDTPEYRSALRDLNTALGLHPDGSVPDSVDVPLGPPQ